MASFTRWKKGFAQVGIVLAENLIGQLHHLHAANAEALALEDVGDFSYEGALQGAGLQENEGFF